MIHLIIYYFDLCCATPPELSSRLPLAPAGRLASLPDQAVTIMQLLRS